MSNHTHSTIQGISILGNSIRGLDFLNWCCVYNTLVVPILMYGAQVWYTGINQKGLITQMQTTQNEGIRKIVGVFKTSLMEPLHNLTHIPPISYLMGKLMHAYSLRLGCLPPHVKVRTVLTADQCQYWPDYVCPPMNLTHASKHLSTPMYQAPSLCTARAWTHPHLTYLLNLPEHITLQHKQSRERHEASNMHIYILPTSCDSLPYTSYHITQGNHTTRHSVTQGINHTQALCQAVHDALTTLETPHTPHLFIWICPCPLLEKLLTLKPHRDFHIMLDSHRLMAAYLYSHNSNTIDVCYFDRTWPGTPSKADLWSLDPELTTLAATPIPLSQQLPRTTMWAKIHVDYIL